MMIFLRYDDLPGVIGRVGTLFGEAGVNIANMTVSRSRRGGEALMVLSVDTRPPDDLVEAGKLAAPDRRLNVGGVAHLD